MVVGHLDVDGLVAPKDFDMHKGMGLVHNVFSKEDLENLPGNCAIGHTRYSTSGGKMAIAGYQPFAVKYSLGNLALAHNGNLSNQAELRSFFEQHGVLMQTNVDSELFLHLISHSKRRSQIDQIFDAMTQAEGAFSCVILTGTVQRQEAKRLGGGKHGGRESHTERRELTENLTHHMNIRRKNAETCGEEGGRRAEWQRWQ